MQQSFPQESTSKSEVIENHGGHQWHWLEELENRQKKRKTDRYLIN